MMRAGDHNNQFMPGSVPSRCIHTYIHSITVSDGLAWGGGVCAHLSVHTSKCQGKVRPRDWILLAVLYHKCMYDVLRCCLCCGPPGAVGVVP